MSGKSTPDKKQIWLHRKQISSQVIKGPSHPEFGRTPWYNNTRKSTKKHKQTFLIGVAGGTASGKTSVCTAVVNNLQLPWVQILSMDCFYRPLTKQERDNVKEYNFDHPNAFDWDLLLKVLTELKQGKACKIPQYDFTTHSRKSEYTLMYGADVVLCEGILMLHDPKIVSQFDVKAFVKTDDDIRLIRRIKRDIAERGRTLDGVIDQYQKTVKPSYQLFCEPTQSVADIVIPRGKENTVAIQLLCDYIKNKLIEGGNVNPVFYKKGDSKNIPSNVMLPRNESNDDKKENNIQIAVDQLHNESVSGKQLLRHIMLLCNELVTLCIKEFIPRRFFTPSPPTNTTTPQKAEKSLNYISLNIGNGKSNDDDEEEIIYLEEDDDDGTETKERVSNISILNESNKSEMEPDDEEKSDKIDIESLSMDDIQKAPKVKPEVCVVTIFSGGVVFGETVMKQMENNKFLDVNYGSIHIFHESKKPAKPRFYDRKLPPNIHAQKVVMLDTFIGTGNRARMALQVIIDHHVPEQNICFITLECSKIGITNLAKVFPNVQFITARIDKVGNAKHWETVPVTSSLVIKYCTAAGIDIIEDEESIIFNQD